MSRRPLLAACVACAVAGCQCLPATTDTYADEIDALGDAPPRADAIYPSRLDLTRIGFPDGPFGGGR